MEWPRPDPHGTGVWRLASWATAPDAVADPFATRLEREPRNARVLNDLAVALTDLSQTRDDPSALIDAFTAADSAVRLAPTLAEAQFTLAVVLEQLYLRGEAIAAWTRYLEPRTRKSPWAAEARARSLAYGAHAAR